MTVYFDLCSLQRPSDDRTQPRVRAEAEAVLALLAAVSIGRLRLIWSDVLDDEAGRNSDPDRRRVVEDVRDLAEQVIGLTADIGADAGRLVAAGLGPFDALHLASATAAGVEYFCTCDDRLVKRGRAIHTPPPWIVTPVELVDEIKP